MTPWPGRFSAKRVSRPVRIGDQTAITAGVGHLTAKNRRRRLIRFEAQLIASARFAKASVSPLSRNQAAELILLCCTAFRKSARRAERRGFGNARHVDARDRLRLKMSFNRFRHVAGGQNDAADVLRGQIAHDPFEKRPAVDRGHRLGQVAAADA